MSRIVSIISGKGGVGKTTVAINLGAAIAHHMKKRVTLIDCNMTASHLGLHLGMYSTYVTLNDVLKEKYSMEQAIYEHFTGMKIIPASLSLRNLQGVDIAKLRSAIDNILHQNDIIMLDSAPGLGREAMATIGASNEVLYVTTPQVPSVTDIIRCQEVVEELGLASLGIVVNMVNKEKHEMTKEEIEHLTSLPVITSIPYDKNIRKSLAMKMPVVSYSPKSLASRKFFDIAEEIMGEEILLKSGLFSPFRKLKFW